MLDTVKINHVQHISFTQSRLTDAVSVILSELLSYEHPPKGGLFKKRRDFFSNSQKIFIKVANATFGSWILVVYYKHSKKKRAAAQIIIRRNFTMKKWVCSVCGYVYEGENPPAECPVCHVGADKFVEQKEEKSWAAEHVVGVGKSFGNDVPEEVRKEIIDGLRANFEGECSEVGMYLAMARVAHREGYPEIGLYWEKAGLEEAEHAAKFAELLGEVITDSTEKNLQMRVDAENGATLGKFELAKLAKKYNLDAIHDTVHEMARDEARHGKAFEGLLERYFGK